MPHPVPRRRALLGAAAFLLVTLTLAPGQAADPPAPPTVAAPAVDLAAELLQIEAAVRALDPAAPDAVARLRELLARLAHVSAQLAVDVARLRQEQLTAAARRPTAPARPATVKGSTTASGKASPAVATSKPGEPGATAGLFAKRGLKKFHRAGCHFGERVKVEERVQFASPADAAAAGLEPCKVCRPGEQP